MAVCKLFQTGAMKAACFPSQTATAGSAFSHKKPAALWQPVHKECVITSALKMGFEVDAQSCISAFSF